MASEDKLRAFAGRLLMLERSNGVSWAPGSGAIRKRSDMGHKKTNVDVGKRGGVPAARHHEKSGNSRKLSGPSVFGLKHEIT